MKFSVIIPVYNSTQYIRSCVETALAQTYTDFELLLVDDGSTDNSGEICDELAESDSRIKVIHKPNGGTSDARNCGLRSAQGEYVMFMDNDDMWNGNTGLCEIAARLDESKADFLTFPIQLLHSETGEKRMSFRLFRKFQSLLKTHPMPRELIFLLLKVLCARQCGAR